MNIKAISNQQFSANNNDNKKSLRACVTATTALGVATALACIAKKQGFSLNPSKIAKTPIKDWAIFKMGPKQLNLEQWEFAGVAAGSVGGGLLGGLLFDRKENFTAKAREAVNQVVGNIGMPLAFVALTAKQFKNSSPLIKVIATIVSLTAGIFAGNEVANFMNEKIYKAQVHRGVKGTDFAPHVDDLSLALTLMSEKGSILAGIVSKLAPVAMCMPGIEIGITQKGRYDKKA